MVLGMEKDTYKSMQAFFHMKYRWQCKQRGLHSLCGNWDETNITVSNRMVRKGPNIHQELNHQLMKAHRFSIFEKEQTLVQQNECVCD